MYVPALGSALVISLPGETVRATVARVVNPHTVFVELGAPLLNPARAHNYRAGDIVCAERSSNELGELWEAVDERRLAAAAPKKKSKPKLDADARARKKRIRARRKTMKGKR